MHYAWLLLFSLFLTSYGSAKLFNPTFAPTPTILPAFTITPTITPTPTLTPTPTIDYNQAFFDPQSEADFDKVMPAPTPLDNPEEFAKWQDGYLAAVDAKLVDYPGSFIDLDIVGVILALVKHTLIFEW